jgi:predicted O-methyltransferase YrrM
MFTVRGRARPKGARRQIADTAGLVDIRSWRVLLPAAVRKQLKQVFEELASRAVFTQENARRLIALAESAEYAKQHMLGAIAFDDTLQVLSYGLERAPREGLYAEFGVWQGGTINFIADRVGHAITVHGFDSFEGLPEDWQGEYSKGAFHMQGVLPRVRPNVRLHAGWFDDSLPRFAKEHPNEYFAFLHVDCDLYSSTKTIFDHLGDRVRPGSVIVFDEYFNYPGWREHEYRAFQEFVRAGSLRYRYLTYNTYEFNVAVQITDSSGPASDAAPESSDEAISPFPSRQDWRGLAQSAHSGLSFFSSTTFL